MNLFLVVNLGTGYLDILDREFVFLEDLFELFDLQCFDGGGLLPEGQTLLAKNLKFRYNNNLFQEK